METQNSQEIGNKVLSQSSNEPELVFGLVGPIGCNLDHVCDAIQDALRLVQYKAYTIRITDGIPYDAIGVTVPKTSYSEKYNALIDAGNTLRAIANDNAVMSTLAVGLIRKVRATHSASEDVPTKQFAYIVRQFKRPEEIHTMRQIYGSRFIQVSVFAGKESRSSRLASLIKTFGYAPIDENRAQQEANSLIERDQNEFGEASGQRLSDVFFLGDIFVDAEQKERTEQTIRRFVRAFFGATDTSPTRDEFGMYMASAAALRSVDLSRQVGAAIMRQTGEIVALGCNEVPKAGGGAYWCDDPSEERARDIERGHDPNQIRRDSILFQFLELLKDEKILSDDACSHDDFTEVFKKIMQKEKIKNASLMDIIEFGRIIHAEMAAITDAARIGAPLLNTTLICTTFPCHICAKHIVASGISKVLFLEPYPKSLALQLHDDSISLESVKSNRVAFLPFIGISPRRYRSIFEHNRKRKDQEGRAINWKRGNPVPQIDDLSNSYIIMEGEIFSLRSAILIEKITQHIKNKNSTQR